MQLTKCSNILICFNFNIFIILINNLSSITRLNIEVHLTVNFVHFDIIIFIASKRHYYLPIENTSSKWNFLPKARYKIKINIK